MTHRAPMTRHTPWLPVMACTLAALSSSGCISNVRGASAGRIGCRPADITIHDEDYTNGHSWIAECQGRRYQCSAAGDVACTPEQIFDAFAEGASTTTAVVPGTEAIERTLVREGVSVFAVLRTHFEIDTYRYGFAVAPVGHPSVVSLSISGPADELAEACPAGLMVDGRITTLHGTHRINGPSRQYAYRLDLALVRQLAAGQRVVGRICAVEWRLGEPQQHVLRELLARYDEEIAWEALHPSDDEDAPPAVSEVSPPTSGGETSPATASPPAPPPLGPLPPAPR